MTKTMRDQIIRAMRLAAMRGFDPRDSHSVQARKWDDIERMRALRSRSESDANSWLRRNA